MVYARVPRPPLNIREFARTSATTDDDLMKVVMDDGCELFFTFRRHPHVISDPRWRLDKQLLPENLAHLLSEYDLGVNTDFSISEGSGSVGRVLKLDIESTRAHWQVTMWYITEAAIKSIKPARRPKKPHATNLNGKMDSERSSDYH